MTKYFSLIFFITSVFLQAADQPKIQIITARPKSRTFPSLQKLATQKIIQQFQNPHDDKNRKLLQSYVDASALLPDELHTLLKKELAKSNISLIKKIHRPILSYHTPADKDVFRTDNINAYHISPSGTWFIYVDKVWEKPAQFILINLDTNSSKVIERSALFYKRPDEFTLIRPYFTSSDRLFLHGCDKKATEIFEYDPATGDLKNIVSLQCSSQEIKWISKDSKRVMLHTIQGSHELYNTEKEVKHSLKGHLYVADENCLLMREDDVIHCYDAQTGELSISFNNILTSALHYPYVSYVELNDKPTSIDVWSLECARQVKKIIFDHTILDMCLFPNLNLGVLLNTKKQYLVNPFTGEYTDTSHILSSCNAYNAYSVVHGFHRKKPYPILWAGSFEVPLTELHGVDSIQSCRLSQDMTKICGIADVSGLRCLYTYNTCLDTLYKLPVPELLSILLERSDKTGAQDS